MNALQEQIVRYPHILLAVTAKTVIIESDNLSGIVKADIRDPLCCLLTTRPEKE